MFFNLEGKGKSKVSISEELYELQKLYWVTKLAIYNLTEIILGIIRDYFTPCIK